MSATRWRPRRRTSCSSRQTSPTSSSRRSPAGGWGGVGYEGAPPETNLVLVEVDKPEKFLEALAREGVLATPGKPGYVRLCTHLDVCTVLGTEKGLRQVSDAFIRATEAVHQRV